MQKIYLNYKPLQPSVRPSDTGVKYHELDPVPQLQPYIYAYWELKTSRPLNTQFRYKVVADACMDIFFELTHAHESYLMGFCRQFTDFPLGHKFHYIGIRFLPTMFSQLFGIDASEFSNRCERVENVVPSLAHHISSHFNESQTLPEIKAIFDDYFIVLFAKHQPNFDKRLYGAIELILNTKGILNIEKDIETGLSTRQLRRLFHFYLGDSAKTFGKVIRFQNILKAKPSTQSLKENKLYFDAGFYDQAHFIKDFKNLYGMPPSQALDK